MARASGRLRLSAETTSSPLPSPSRRSPTAKAGALLPICARPSLTLSQEVTSKPRVSMARASRSRNALSSSTIRSERSVIPVSSMVVKMGLDIFCFKHMARHGGAAKATVAQQKDCGGTPLPVSRALSSWCVGAFTGFEAPARPYDLHHRAMLRENTVRERDRGAGPLQQRAGDEHAKP